MIKANGQKRSCIALIGNADIDAADIFSLVKSSHPGEVILVGNESKKVAESVCSLLAGSFTTHVCDVISGSYSDAIRADIVVIAASAERVPSESVSEHMLRTAEAVRRDVRSVVDSGFDGVMLVTTNPIDIMCYVAKEESKFPAERIIGLGTSVDLDALTQIHSPAPNTWCSGMHFNTAFLDHCDPTCPHFESVVQKARAVHLNDLNYAGNRTAGMATCVSRICKAIVNNEREVFPVSAFLRGEYDESGLFLTVPCVIGRNGVERIVKLPTRESEKQRIRKYAAELRGLLGDLGLVTKAAAHKL